MPCYPQRLQDYRDKVRWIAFIDADELLILKSHADVRLLLFEYEAHAGLAVVHWVTHGSGGHLGSAAGWCWTRTPNTSPTTRPTTCT